jgi:hypothetical protein
MKHCMKLTTLIPTVAFTFAANDAHDHEAEPTTAQADGEAELSAASANDEVSIATDGEAGVNIDSPPKKTVEIAQVGAGAGVGVGPAGTDHSQFIGTFAIGYLGFREMLIGSVGGGTDTTQAPVIGVRYWIDSMLGIDVGLGFSSFGGSIETEAAGMTTETDIPGPLTFIIHGGVPLALADSQHFVFEVVPELNFGLSSSTVEMGDTETSLSGTHFDIGARAGAEIHFGFIDIPQLALQAGVGLRLSMDSTSAENEDADTKVSNSLTSIGTTVGDNPWNIFAANVAALYYFDN